MFSTCRNFEINSRLNFQIALVSLFILSSLGVSAQGGFNDPGIITGNQTLCPGAVAATITNGRSACDATEPFDFGEYQWQSSHNGTSWLSLVGENQASYSPGTITAKSYFRRKALCNNLYSNVVVIDIYSVLSPGSISDNQTIQYNQTPTPITGTSASGGNAISYSYQWQNFNGSIWANISGATSLNYSPANLTTTTLYKRIATDACGNQAVSNTITITVCPSFDPGSIAGNDLVVCINSSVSGFITSPASGVPSYQWEKSVAGGAWQAIVGATSANYSHGVINQTTQFRRYVVNNEILGCTSSGYTNIRTITVSQPLSAGSIGGAQTICYNTVPSNLTTLTNYSGGLAPYTVQWQKKPTESGSWQNILDNNISTQGNLTTSHQYRKVITACGQQAITDPVTVNVLPDLNPGSISTSSSSACSTTALVLGNSNNPTGGNNQYSYQWKERQPGYILWTNIPGANASTLSNYTLTSTKEVVREVSTCTQTKLGNVIQLNYLPNVTPGSIQGTSNICINSDVSSLSELHPAEDGDGSYLYQWQSRTGNTDWINIPGATAAGFDPGVINETTYFRRGVTSCNLTVYSDGITVSVNQPSQGGIVNAYGTGNNLIEEYGISSGQLSLDNAMGTVQQWQQSINGGSWTDIGATAGITLFTFTNITSNTSFRAIVKNGACAPAPSASATVKIYNVPSLTIDGNSLIAPGGSTRLVTDNNFYTYEWFHNNILLPDQSANILTVTKPGRYKVTVKGSSSSIAYTTGEIEIGNLLESSISEMNYVRTIQFNKAGESLTTNLFDLNVGDFVISTTYFDGLGRPVQSVGLGAAGNGNDLITPVAYDAFGREAKKYLPYAHANRDGRYQPTALADQSNFYSNAGDKVADDIAPFSETIFEPSPLNRIIKQGAPGIAWQPDTDHTYNSTDHSVKFSYEFNLANEVLQWTFAYPTEDYTTTALNAFGKVEAGTAIAPVFYPANQLYKNKTKDEQGNQVIEYVDKEGRTLLKRVQVLSGNPSTTDTNRDTNWASTYYIYDDFGNLVCVLSPESVKNIDEYLSSSDSVFKESFLRKWAFRYRYDGRGRMVLKQVPGVEPVFMVYDNRDRLVLTQDGNQRSENKWSFIKYDALNRPIINGIYTHNNSINQAQMSALISTTNFFDSYNGNTSFHGYSNMVFPTTNADNSPLEILGVTYYDNYQFRDDLVGGSYNYVPGDLTGQAEAFNRVVGLVTGTKTNVLGTSDFLWSVNYYDDKYRTIQVITQNHKGGFDRATNRVDFVGKVLEAKITHDNGTTAHAIRKRYEYDHAGRLLKTYYKLNSEQEIILSATEYNELGEVITKKLHSNDNGSTFRQHIDYRYNIRGWLTRLNNSDLNTDDGGPKDFFGMDLTYNNQWAGINNTPTYNGNISAIKWSSNLGLGASINLLSERGYKYTYDPLNRLTASTHLEKAATWDTSTAHHEDNLSYDLNGSIETLNRKGSGGVNLDQLSYTYNGNQIMTITDAGNAAEGFKDGNTTGNDFVYDANGNTTVDKNKGITSIIYNYLNLPVKMNKSTGEYIGYTYDAAGGKLSQSVYNASNVLQKQNDYVGEFFYQNDTLKFINNNEGRIVMTGSTPEYQYNLRDYLGNVRLTFTTKDETEESTATFETSSAATEQSQFLYYNEAAKVNTTLFDHTNSGSTYYATRLNGSVNERYGLAKSLSVMPGDTIRAEVHAKYLDTNSSNWTTALNNLITSIANGTAPAGTFVDGGATGSTGGVTPPYTSLLNKGSETGTAPKAYLNYLIFDRNYNLLNGGFVRMSENAREYGQDRAHEKLAAEFVTKEPGYVYIYLSNDNAALGGAQIETYWDDFLVEQVKSPIVSMDDYMAFGMEFNSYVRESSLEQRWKFGSKETIDDLGIDLSDFGPRQYDNKAPHFLQVDPMTDVMTSHTPYHYGYNNPVMMVDPSGMMPTYHYDWDTGEYIKTNKNGKTKTVSSEEALASVTQNTQKGNVAVAIEGEDMMKMLNSLDYDKGSWHVIVAKDFVAANDRLGKYLDGNQIDNLMIYAHGNNFGGYIKPAGDDGRGISEKSIAQYLNAVEKGVNTSGHWGADQISALQQMSARVKDNGRMVFSTCWAAYGESGAKLAGQLHKLTGERLNLFLNQDYSNRTYYDGAVEVWTGKGLTPEKALKQGWIQVAPNGEIFQLRGQGKKGNLRLDSRSGKRPVNID